MGWKDVGKWACPLGRATHVTGQWRRCRRLTLLGLDFIHLHMHAYDEIYLFGSPPFIRIFFFLLIFFMALLGWICGC